METFINQLKQQNLEDLIKYENEFKNSQEQYIFQIEKEIEKQDDQQFIHILNLKKSTLELYQLCEQGRFIIQYYDYHCQIQNNIKNAKQNSELMYKQYIRIQNILFQELCECLEQIEQLRPIQALIHLSKIKENLKKIHDNNNDLQLFTNLHLILMNKLQCICPFWKEPQTMVFKNIINKLERTNPMTFYFIFLKVQLKEVLEHDFDFIYEPTNSYRFQMDEFTILYKNDLTQNEQNIFQDLIQFYNEGPELIENYINKSQELILTKEIKTNFISKMSKNWYLGVQTQNIRGNKLNNILKNVIQLSDLWKSQDIQSTAQFIKENINNL